MRRPAIVQQRARRASLALRRIARLYNALSGFATLSSGRVTLQWSMAELRACMQKQCKAQWRWQMRPSDVDV